MNDPFPVQLPVQLSCRWLRTDRPTKVMFCGHAPIDGCTPALETVPDLCRHNEAYLVLPLLRGALSSQGIAATIAGVMVGNNGRGRFILAYREATNSLKNGHTL